MVRIRIDDLPISEQLTPEEEEQILGAGRRSFRPMLEQLEGRELYSANVTASLTAGVLNVRGQHVQGTPNNDAVAIRRVDNQIQVMSGPKNETMVGKFDAAQVRTIDLLMEGGGDAVLDLTGLGRLGGDARFNTKGDGGTADVRYVNQAGSQVREWESAGRHNKETILTNGDKVLEQSWQDGQLTRRFVTVTDTRGRQLVTAEDNGNGFVVTRTHPGVSQTKFKFDRYGGMWDGKDWVPEQGQKLVERDGKPVNGEMKMIDNKLRFVLTTGSQSDRQVETYEAFGNGSGEKKLSVEDYKDNKLSWRLTFNADGSRTAEDFKDNNLSRRETFKADGSRTVEDYKNGVLSRRETTSDEGEVRSRIEVYNDAGQLQTVDTIDKNGTKSHGEWMGDKWVVTTPGSGNVLTRTQVFDKDGGTVLYTETIMKDGAKLRTSWNSGLWVEESWSADGKTYTKTVWTKEDHGEESTIIKNPNGTVDRTEFNENLKYRTVIANGVMTVTGYNMKGNTVFKQLYANTAERATVTWTYSLNSDGTIRKLIRYEAHTLNSSKYYQGRATWETGKGWEEWYARTYSQPVFAPPDFMDGSNWRGWITDGDFRGYWPMGRPG